MRKKPIITSAQLVLMTVGSALMFPYTFLPILTVTPANQDMWIVLLMAIVYIVLLNAPLLFLINKFRGLNANQICEIILGKPMGMLAAFVFVLLFLFCETACMMVSGQFVSIYLLPETPTWGLLIFYAIPVCYVAYKGAGTIGRFAPFLVVFMLVTIIAFALMGIDKMNLKELQPVLSDSTFLQLNKGAFLTAARFSEILIFFVFSYYLGGKVSIIKTYAVAISIFAVSFMLILLPTMLVLGVQYAKHVWSPYYVYTRQVEFLQFLERVAAANVLALIPCTILNLSMYCYMASHMFSGIVRSKTHKHFVILFTLLAYIICLFPVMQKTGTFEFLSSDKFFPFVIVPVIFILPVIMLITYLFRSKKINAQLADKKTAQEAAK
jgi:spore germination protein KB